MLGREIQGGEGGHPDYVGDCLDPEPTSQAFGRDSSQSVLDLNCKAHEIDNLYVTDASFLPSIGAANPTLTLIANTLRVADQIIGRLK